MLGSKIGKEIGTQEPLKFLEGDSLAANGLASMGFAERYGHEIAVLSQEVKAELQPYLLHFLKNPHNSMSAFDSAIKECCLDGVLTDTERLTLHDNLLRLMEAPGEDTAVMIDTITKEMIANSEDLEHTLVEDVLAAERGQIALELQRVLLREQEQGVVRSSLLRSLHRISAFDRLSEAVIEELVTEDPSSPEFFDTVTDILNDYQQISGRVPLKVFNNLRREICSAITEFRGLLIQALNREITEMEEQQEISSDQFAEFSNQPLPGEEVVTDITTVAGYTALAYRAEQITASLLTKYTAEGNTGSCLVSQPFSITDRCLHGDVHFEGKAYDVKTSPHAYLREVAQRLGYAHNDLHRLGTDLAKQGVELTTSGGEAISIFKVVNNPERARDPEMYAKISGLLKEQALPFAGGGRLMVIAKPMPIVMVPNSAIEFIPHLEQACSVQFDPLANRLGSAQLENVRQWSGQFIHNRHDTTLKLFARRFEAAMAEGKDPSISVEDRKVVGLAAVKLVVDFGFQVIGERDLRLLKVAGAGGYDPKVHRPLVCEDESRLDLEKSYSPALVQIWEDFGVVTFNNAGNRVVIPGSISVVPSAEKVLGDGVRQLVRDKADGLLSAEVAESIPDSIGNERGQSRGRLPREVKQQVLNGVTKLLPGDTKISYLVPNASFDGSTRAELESRLGNSPVEVMESAGLITVSPLGRLASFKSSVRPTMGA